MTYKKRNPTLFQEFNIGIEKLEYPVIVIYNNKQPYTSGDIEMFHENGTRTFLGLKEKCLVLSKSKYKPRYSFTVEEAREEYEKMIRTLLYIHDISTVDEFNRKYEEFDAIFTNLDNLTFEDEFQARVDKIEMLQQQLKVKSSGEF